MTRVILKMRDTDETTEKIYRELMSQKSGEERMKMAFSMFRFAGELVLSSLREKGVKEKDLRKEAFLRIYGNDFSEDEKKKIIERIEIFEKN